MLISFVIPTRNRPQELAYTLGQLEMLDIEELGGQSELVVVDNGSDEPTDLPAVLKNGIRIKQVLLGKNLGAGARNVGSEHAIGDWIIMLDDDSSLRPGTIGAYLRSVDPLVGAVGGEIFLPSGVHEAGGLPEVIVGCGCAIRRDVFVDLGGYDSSFGYYAEEYDLCAKMIAGGYRVMHTRAFEFEHRKSLVGRDMDQILYRLVRNNGWVIQRYAPEHLRAEAIMQMVRRYGEIAVVEQAQAGFDRGLAELEATIDGQSRLALSDELWDRFVGIEAMREGLFSRLTFDRDQVVRLVGPPRGKGLGLIKKEIKSMGYRVCEDDSDACCVEVIGTLSPGPMLDAKLTHPDALFPWLIEESSVISVQR